MQSFVEIGLHVFPEHRRSNLYKDVSGRSILLFNEINWIEYTVHQCADNV